MRVTVALIAFGVCVFATIVGLVMFASSIPHDACAGAVFDTSICENVRLRQSILASVLIGSAFVAAAVVAGAVIVSRGRGGRPAPIPGGIATE